MQTEIIYLIVGLLVGFVVAWMIVTRIERAKGISKSEFDSLAEKLNGRNSDLNVEKEKTRALTDALHEREQEVRRKSVEVTTITGLLSAKSMEFSNARTQLDETKSTVTNSKAEIVQLQANIHDLERNLATSNANLVSSKNIITTNGEDNKQLKAELQLKTAEFNKATTTVAELTAGHKSLNEKLETQKTEIEGMRKQFNTEFENIATKILDEKTKKFTDLNKDNLETILKPLGENLESFKKKIEEVYISESRERFSLGKEVEKLVLANQTISQEANNLTNALTSKGKIQGDWGQMILESILEKSGLGKDREYFVQEYLKDEHGNNLVNELGNKMQPDVTIAYPDNRKVIVDSKVSLTAYTRYMAATANEEEKKSLNDHLKSIRNHIDDLSAKNYQDFAPSLDFVMMFVPIEPAYLIAVHTDPELWSYAYNKRILLTSPSNLIVALKMIVDLWKRDLQSKNHEAIVDRGGKLYDKFAMVLDSFKDIGSNLRATQKSYNTAVSQLSEGNDNVLKQVGKLKSLGVKAKKNLPDPGSLPLLDINEDDDDDANTMEH